jgi:hypothetical protein
MPWPTTDELFRYLVGAGLNQFGQTQAQQMLDFQGALDGAVNIWNDRTHYWPFLSTASTSEERRFDPPNTGCLLDFNGGLVTFTSLTVDLTYANASGSARVNVRDFWLRPADAAPRKKPWTYAIMRHLWASHEPQSIAVVGEWGYCTDANLPAAARTAVLAIAARQLLPQIQTQISRGGLIKLTEGDSSKQWGFAELGQLWDGVVDRAVAQYARPRVA